MCYLSKDRYKNKTRKLCLSSMHTIVGCPHMSPSLNTVVWEEKGTHLSPMHHFSVCPHHQWNISRGRALRAAGWREFQNRMDSSTNCQHDPHPGLSRPTQWLTWVLSSWKPSRKLSSSSSALSIRSAYSPTIQIMAARASGSSRESRFSHSVAITLSYLESSTQLTREHWRSLGNSGEAQQGPRETGRCSERPQEHAE